MENKEHVTELKTVQKKTRKATHAIESMGANENRKKRSGFSIWEDRSWKDEKEADKETWTNGCLVHPTQAKRLPLRPKVFYAGKSQQKKPLCPNK